MESKGQQVVGSDGERGSYGGGREWCGVMEKGSSPGVVVAHVRSSSPMPPRHCSCPHIVACVPSFSWAVVFVHTRSSSFTCSFMGTCHRVCPSRLIAMSHCQWVVVLGVCGCSWCWALVAIHGWWCGHSIVLWSGGVVVLVHGVACSPYMAWVLGSSAIRCAPSSWGCKQG